MICQVNIMPDYINNLDISPASKQQARNVHVSVVNELMNLKTKDNYNVFVNDTVVDFSVIALNPMIDKLEALAIANNKISELNKTYDNPIKFLNSVDKIFIAVNVSDFANSIESTKDQYTDTYLKDNSKFFNLEAHAEQKIDQSVKQNCINFLNKLGVNVEAVNENGISGKGLADILNRVVKYTLGYESVLPEEAAHFLTSLMPQEHPVMKEALRDIVNYPIYKEVVETYGERYGNNELKLRHEAVGKLIAQRIKNRSGRIENMIENEKPIGWMKSILNWFKSLFQAKQEYRDDVFDDLATRIIEGNVSDLSFENIVNEVIADGIFLSQTKYEEMMAKYDAMSENKQKKVTKQIRSMFSNINALKKSINEMEVNLEAASKTMFDKTLQFLKNAVYNVENTSISSVNTFIEMAIQTELMLKDFHNETEVISEISDPNLRLFKLYQFNRSTDLLTKSIVPQLAEIYRNLNSNDGPMYNTIGNILTLSSFIEGFINNEYMEILSEVYPEMLRERTEAITKKINEEIEPLKRQLESAISRGDKKNEKYLKDKIDKKLKEMKQLGTEERIKDILTGLAGDSSGMSFWVEGASMSGDIIVNELDDFIKTCVLSNYEQYQTLARDMANAVDKFQKKSGRSKNNPDEFYKNIIEEVTVVTGIDEKGEPITYKRKKFVDGFNPEYIYELTLREQKIEHIKKQELAETDGAKREELNKEKQAMISEYNKFLRENFVLDTTDEYNKVTALLDEDLGNGMTAREATKDIYRRMNLKQNEIRRTSSVERLEVLYDDLLQLIRELKTLKSEYNKTGIDLKVAKQLKLYSKKMKEMVDHELTDESYADHNKHLLELKRELDNGEITQEEYEYKVEKSYETRPTKAYMTVREDLIERIRQISERQSQEILNKNSVLKENISELYKEMEDAVSRLRNEYGEVEIDDVDDPEAKKLVNFIREKEKKIIAYREQMIKATGFSQEAMRRKKELISLFKFAHTAEERKAISAEIERLNKEATGSSLDVSSRDELIDLMAMLDEMTSTENSQEYEEKLKEQTQMLVSDMEDFSKSEKFIDDEGIVYDYNDELNIWVSSTGEELSDVEVNSISKYRAASEKVKTTEWFKANHIKRNVFIEGGFTTIDMPIYIWRTTKPADPSYSEKVPAFRFRQRVIKPEFKNKDSETIDGKPLPKKDGKFKSKTKLTDAEQEFLDTLLKVHYGFQRKIPLGKRIGSFLPSIPKGGFEKAITTNVSKIGNAIRSTYDWAIRAVKGNEQDQDYITGKLYDNFLGDIPLLFTGKIDAEQQTSDAAYAVLHFAGHIIRYDALKQAIPLAAGTSKVLANPQNRPIRPEKLKMLERAADPAAFAMTLTSEDRIKNQSIREKHVNSIINRAFYGQHQYSEEVNGVNIGKIANEGMQIAAYQILGGKIMANIKNNIAGKIQMFLASRFLKNKIYDERNLAFGQMKSFQIMSELLNDRYKGGNLGYYHQLLNMVNAFQGEFYNEFGQKVSATLLKDAANIRNLFMVPKNVAEVEMQIVNAMAVLDSMYIEHEGKKIPLHNVFELRDGVIAAKKEFDAVEVKKLVNDAIRKIAHVNIVTNGNFDRMNAVEAEKYSIGRLLLFLNKYFVPMFMFRYADTRYNASINEITTGYHREFFTTILNDVRNGYFPLYRMVTNPDQYTSEEKNAALTASYELGILILLGLGYSLLGGKEPDKYQKLKEDPNGYWRAQVLNMILSIKLETETVHPFYGIDNIAQKIKSPFPVARLYENIVKFAYTLNFGDEDFYKRDTGMYSKGQAKAIAYALKLSGLEGILLEIGNPIERLKRTEQSQFIKQ